MEDKLLIWKLNRGRVEALCRIYEKYRDDLVRIAGGLSNDTGAAEDAVHDVFMDLVRCAGEHQIRKSLKGYLTTCVVNKIRNLHRGKIALEHVGLDDVGPGVSDCKGPEECLSCEEEFEQLYEAMARLPYEQKEAVILHIQGKMKFREIAELQEVSIKTVMSRYKYGLDKLRSMLTEEVEK